MKTFLTTAFSILLFTVACSAQNTFPASGNAGIGTTSPAASLQVAGDIRFGTNGTYTDFRMFTDGVLSGYNQVNSITPVTVPGSGTAKAALYLKNKTATGTTRMDLLVDGNVGIGNAAPGTSLHVGPGGVFSMRDGTGASFTPALINSQTSGVAGLGVAVVDGVNNPRIGLFADQPNNIVGISTVYSSNSPAFVYRGAGTGEVLRITPAGNLGIGTANPDSKLTVNGTVHSTVVLVDNTVIPDYVFNKTYALRPLSAVKAYIDLNHHLPEIPSAAEVAKNGQNLGEMNALLLKKVEELTLYMIELNKTTAELNKKVKAQQQEIEQLKKAHK